MPSLQYHFVLVEGFPASSFFENRQVLKGYIPLKDKNVQFWLVLTLFKLFKDLNIP